VRDGSSTAARGPRKEANFGSIPGKDVLEPGTPYIREAATIVKHTATGRQHTRHTSLESLKSTAFLETFIRRDFLFVSFVLLAYLYCK
jgi:hypothetical protein